MFCFVLIIATSKLQPLVQHCLRSRFMSALPKAEFHPTPLLGNTDICRTEGKKKHRNMHSYTLCALPSKTCTGTGILCHCFARKYPKHAHEYVLLHMATSSPTPYSFKSIIFALPNAALVERLHHEEGNSPHTPVIMFHEILPLLQQPPSEKKIKSKFITPRKEQQAGV